MGVATAVSVVAALQRQRCSTLRCIHRRYNESLASLVLSGNPLGDKGGRSLMRLQYTRSGKVRRAFWVRALQCSATGQCRRVWSPV